MERSVLFEVATSVTGSLGFARDDSYFTRDDAPAFTGDEAPAFY